MQLEVLGAIGLFLLRLRLMGAEAVLLWRCLVSGLRPISYMGQA